MALKQFRERTTLLDRVVVAVLLGVCLALFVAIGLRPAGESIQVLRDGKVVYSAPLSAEQTVDLNGPLGETRLAIHNGQARILSSPCPSKVCIGMGAIRHHGEIIACVPNHLLVSVIGGKKAGQEPDYDLLSR